MVQSIAWASWIWSAWAWDSGNVASGLCHWITLIMTLVLGTACLRYGWTSNKFLHDLYINPIIFEYIAGFLHCWHWRLDLVWHSRYNYKVNYHSRGRIPWNSAHLFLSYFEFFSVFRMINFPAGGWSLNSAVYNYNSLPSSHMHAYIETMNK